MTTPVFQIGDVVATIASHDKVGKRLTDKIERITGPDRYGYWFLKANDPSGRWHDLRDYEVLIPAQEN